MAQSTPKYYKSLSVYEVYVRNHGPNGNFKDIESDLDRIKGLGIDIIWFMPVHPIGELNRKGTLGCPYSIKNYRDINPEYGTMDDFKRLIDKAHLTGLKVMIDVVFNHTAHDSVLASEHPDWFHTDSNNNPVSTVANWSDVADLKYPNPDLEKYLIDTLLFWVKLGIDGFRCDVASLIPIQFWKNARYEVEKINPDIIWLAESVDARWIPQRRGEGFKTNSDSELYQMFDITYDYDIWAIWQAAAKGKVPVSMYTDMLHFQESIYPENYVKLRCVENHDRERIMSLAATENQALAWTVFQLFNKGMALIYAGQESSATNTPSLFDKDTIEWDEYGLTGFIKRLLTLKKDPVQINGKFKLYNSESGIQAAWLNRDAFLYGIFNIEGIETDLPVNLTDGKYKDALTDKHIIVKDGKINMPTNVFILTGNQSIKNIPYRSVLLDIE